jgi:chorismate synthase
VNTFGHNIRLTSFGESHGKLIGAVLDGMPAGYKLDLGFIQMQLARRRPGQSDLTTARNEPDEFELCSGVLNGLTTGAPIMLQIQNKDQKSKDYNRLKEVYRPSHADYTYAIKYGLRDHNGGGRSSARVTAGWVGAGAMVQSYLEQEEEIKISAYVKQIGAIQLTKTQYYSREEVDANAVRCPEAEIASKMEQQIRLAKEDKDSLGGIIECVITGMPVGVGEPVFNKLNAALGKAMFNINAVKGVEFGGGFQMAAKRGSEVNDEFISEAGEVRTASNFSGGIQGGISNGMDIVFRVAFKPTSTIGVSQKTIDSEGNEINLQASGRHDPCVVPRAVPIVETMAALVVGDLLI